jgi:hypothetical protein
MAQDGSREPDIGNSITSAASDGEPAFTGASGWSRIYLDLRRA